MQLLFVFLIVLLFSSGAFANQASYKKKDTISSPDSLENKDCYQKDVGDLLRKKGKPPKPQKRTSLLIIPSVAANPANGFMINVGGNAGWYFGKREETNVSFAGFTVTVTTKQQLLTFLKTNIYTPKNK